MKRHDFLRLGLLLPIVPLLDARCAPPAAAAAVTGAMFVDKAGTAGMFEIESSKLVLAASPSPPVKSFAEKMITDHTIAAEELKSVASGKYKLPSGLDAKHQAMLDELKAAGERGERTYVEMQVKAHEEAVALFGGYGKQGDDVALQAFAIKTLPTLEMHSDMIKKISAGMS